MTKEKLFENKVKKFLEDNECWYIKYWAGAVYTKTGIPDLLICCNGYFLGVEIKAEHGKTSPLQDYNINEIKKAGGIGLVLYPKDFDDFKKLLYELKER